MLIGICSYKNVLAIWGHSRWKLTLTQIVSIGAFSFVLTAILNSQEGCRCTLVPRLPFPVPGSRFPVPRPPSPVPRSPFPVPRSPFPVPRSSFPVLVTSRIGCTHAKHCPFLSKSSPNDSLRGKITLQFKGINFGN